MLSIAVWSLVPIQVIVQGLVENVWYTANEIVSYIGKWAISSIYSYLILIGVNQLCKSIYTLVMHKSECVASCRVEV